MTTAADPLAVRLTSFIPEDRRKPGGLHPPQHAFLLLSHLEVLEGFYGGAAGGGKSDALLMAALQYVDVPGYAALLLRRTYADLALPGAIMDRAKTWLTGGAAKWNENEKTFTFPSSARLSFGYLQTTNDKYRYQSAEFQFIGYDELTHFKDEADYTYLLSRLRKPSTGPLSRVPLRMRSASNPGGAGHKWVKRRLIDRLPNPDDPEDTPAKCRARVFIPAKLSDNPSVDQEGYANSLAGLDPQTRAQLLNGDWNARGPGEWVFPEGLNEVFALGAKLREQRLAGKLRPPVGSEVVISADYGVNTHVLITWPLEAGGAYVVAEHVYHGDSVWELADPIASTIGRVGWPVHELRFDAAAPGLNKALLRDLRPKVNPKLRYLAVPFGDTGRSTSGRSYKVLGIDHLRLLVAKTRLHVRGEPDVIDLGGGKVKDLGVPVAPLLAIDERACPVLAEQMGGMKYSDPDAGKVEKGQDHGFDALVAWAAPEFVKRLKKGR